MGQLTYITLISISLHENIMIGKEFWNVMYPITELRQTHYNHNGIDAIKKQFNLIPRESF